MPERMKKRWRCNECDQISSYSDLLKAKNPFDTNETINGCPACKSIDSFSELCDVNDCDEIATCGRPTDNGYVRTCYRHFEVH